MPGTKTIRGVLLIAAVLFSSVIVATTHFAVSFLFERSLRKEALADAESFAEITFKSMFQLMRTGWSRQQLEGFIAAIQSSIKESRRQIDIYRGNRVSVLFGEIPQREPDEAIEQVFREGHSRSFEQDGRVRYLYALKAQEVCQGCHTNVEIGDVLGVIDVRQNIAPVLEAHQLTFAIAMIPLAPVAVLATLMMVVFIRRRFEGAIVELAGSIRSVNRLADLRKLEDSPPSLGFAEFDPVSREIGELTSRVRSIAVDKDMLEFEIRLLEKFVLTSDVIRDWRDYVIRLLLDIDGVMPAYALFSIFKTGDDAFDLEVFWRFSPNNEMKEDFERRLRDELKRTDYFDAGYAMRVNHHVADHGQPMPEITGDAVALQSKSLLVDAPRIGGIVGIGMEAQGDVEPTHVLVIESVLSTLLNVVGSVKAIDRYTKDLEYYATRDPLTNFYNQRVFWEVLENEIHRSARHNYAFALLVVDTDGFKSINDRYGHGFGDTYLQCFADTLRGAIRDDDMPARYGGDEFVVILPETDLAGAVEVARRVAARIAELSVDTPDGSPLRSSASIGIGCYPTHATVAKDLFMFSDSMMYRAKGGGDSKVAVPTEEDVVDIFKKLGEQSMMILQAVDRRAVVPYFQPIVRTRDGAVEALQVLSRIRLANGDHVLAEEYVAAAERMGVMHKLDYMLMEQALYAIENSGYEGVIFLNLSPRAMQVDEFVGEIRSIADDFNVDPSRIVLEIAERETVRNMSVLERFVARLHGEGFKLAIHNFGSGFSSFHYVKRLPIDYLKIEGGYVLGMRSNEKDRALVRSIAALASDLGIRTIAEHVEDELVMAQVVAQGIDLAQGFHVMRPTADIAAALAPGAP
ncbi:MAG: EAL domain-containing protein [Rhodocyclaceae bacterium]|nr:EAL domain-containing protein [Rhodocyclaceae bacterium]